MIVPHMGHDHHAVPSSVFTVKLDQRGSQDPSRFHPGIEASESEGSLARRRPRFERRDS